MSIETPMTLESMVGRQLIVGLPGPDATDDDLRLLRDIHAGGLMLYRRNFETPERFLRFIARLEEGLGRRLLITTDHEGGRIIMLNKGVTIFPDNLTAGTAGDETMVARQGLIEGRELRRLGVDVNFGPCLDVLTERYSPNIGIRSYGKDPALVSRLGAARIRGMQAGGISACAKHFPGKGHAPVDAHLGLPVIDSDWGDMHALHLPPFMAAMEAGVDCIMTSHPLYPNLDPTPAMPASVLEADRRGLPARAGRLPRGHHLGRPRDGRDQRAVPDRRGHRAHRRRRARPAAGLPHRAGPARGVRGGGRGLSRQDAADPRAREEHGAARRARRQAAPSASPAARRARRPTASRWRGRWPRARSRWWRRRTRRGGPR